MPPQTLVKPVYVVRASEWNRIAAGDGNAVLREIDQALLNAARVERGADEFLLVVTEDARHRPAGTLQISEPTDLLYRGRRDVKGVATLVFGREGMPRPLSMEQVPKVAVVLEEGEWFNLTRNYAQLSPFRKLEDQLTAAASHRNQVAYVVRSTGVQAPQVKPNDLRALCMGAFTEMGPRWIAVTERGAFAGFRFHDFLRFSGPAQEVVCWAFRNVAPAVFLCITLDQMLLNGQLAQGLFNALSGSTENLG